MIRPLSLLACIVFGISSLRAAEAPLLKTGDVVALVGGEEMAAAAENGQVELLLTRAVPDRRLKFRSLAWEGDTVYEQPRDLNYPSLEQQLDEIGATVVLVQFGLMESLAGADKLPEFTAAYEKLLGRLSGGWKRSVHLVLPAPVANGRFQALAAYSMAIRGLANRMGLYCLPPGAVELTGASYRDGIHLNNTGNLAVATSMAQTLLHAGVSRQPTSTEELRLADAIRAKNRLWYHYYRPQNWAFLNGDRTIQPSSRDHLDPSKRWFPEEMKQWLPLIEAKEQEIWTLAGRLGK